MTQNQIAAQNLRETERHNLATEEQSKFMNTETAGHYQRQDSINKEHYERADQASIISANASAMNAQTNRSQYNMQYDIEYGWTGDGTQEIVVGGQTYKVHYPEGMPLSAQIKTTELNKSLIMLPAEYAEKQSTANKNQSQTVKNVTGAFNDFFTAIFGKKGAAQGVSELISDDE